MTEISPECGRCGMTENERLPRSDAEAVALRFASAMGNDPSTMYELLADDFVRRGEQTAWMPMGKANYVAMSENFLAPFPDVSWTVEDLLSEDDRVLVQIVESGTFTAPWVLGDLVIPPTGTAYSSHGMVLMTIRAGQISTYTYVHDAGFSQAYGKLFDDAFATAYFRFLIEPYLSDE